MFFVTKAQISITSTGIAFTQDFDGMGATTIATLPLGFKIGTDWNSGTTVTTQSRGISCFKLFKRNVFYKN